MPVEMPTYESLPDFLWCCVPAFKFTWFPRWGQVEMVRSALHDAKRFELFEEQIASLRKP
jgi:hypothetical protein